jgi:glutamate N-acetyltransferase/amino-acid N-acetyltransferase
MAVNLQSPDPKFLFPISGVRIGVTEAGVRKPGRKDLTVVLIDEGASVAGVFTNNRYCAAPVQVCRTHLDANAGIRAMLINTGNANAGTGAEGLRNTHTTCLELATRIGVKPNQILPFSTGVIMEPLPVDRVVAGMDAAIADASPDNWLRAAEGIMTTDTVPKAFGVQANIGGRIISISGISKGAGMIRPNMATMLGFIATDACVDPSVMRELAYALAEGLI